MILVKQERLIDCLEELAPMLAEHWREVEHDKEEVPINPDFATYLEVEADNHLILVTSRGASGRIVGYMWDIVAPNPHYNEIYSVNDVVYVSPEHRGSGLMKRMCSLMEKRAAKMKAVVRTINLKTISKDKFEGYEIVEVVYHKSLRGL